MRSIQNAGQESIEQKNEQENKFFFNRIAEYYDKLPVKNWFAKSHKRVIEIINVREKSRILDAGCGTGNFLMLLHEKEQKEKGKKNLNLYGIDISKGMLNVARKKLKNNARLKLQSAEKLNFKDNSFDYIFSIYSFHHYSNYNLVMKNFYRILRKNGCLVVVDVDFGHLLNYIFHKIEPANNRMHSAAEFRKLFEKNRFKDIKQKRIGLISILTAGKK